MGRVVTRCRADHDLNVAITGEASDEYRAGWAVGDVWCEAPGADLHADAPVHWSDEKCHGFWDRLKVQRDIRDRKGGPCTICSEYTAHPDYGSCGPWNCGKDSCIPF